MDGYAVRAADMPAASADRPTVPPGARDGGGRSCAVGRRRPGDATRIMTGAPMPEGADTVVRVEDTDGGTERVAVRAAATAAATSARGAKTCARGTVVPAGTPIGAAQIGVLASVGAAVVDVTGGLGSPSSAPATSSWTSTGFTKRSPATRSSRPTTIRCTRSPARRAATRPTWRRADPAAGAPGEDRQAAGQRSIVTTAGISVGEFDYIREVLRGLGAEMGSGRCGCVPGHPSASAHWAARHGSVCLAIRYRPW